MALPATPKNPELLAEQTIEHSVISYDKSKLLVHLQMKILELGFEPTGAMWDRKRMGPLSNTYRAHFGSFKEALRQAQCITV